MATWTKADIAYALTFELRAQTIPVLLPMLRYAQFGQEGKFLPGTDTIRWVKKPYLAQKAAVADYALDADEVTSPTVEKMPALTKVDLTSSPYGRTLQISRREASYDPLDMVGSAKDQLAFDAAYLIDTIVKEALALGGTVVRAAGRASTITVAAGDTLKASDVRKFAPKLRSLNVPFTDGSLNGVTHPNAVYDLMTDTVTPGGWQNASLYAGSSQLFNGELGQLAGVRFVDTTLCSKQAAAGASAIDVYETMVGIGDWCLGKATIERLRFTAVAPVPSAADPLGLKWILGFAVDYGAKILDTARFLRVEHAITTL